MRTDSTRYSNVFVGEAFSHIEGKYGKSYIGYLKKGKKNENIQDAHEAIRPTSVKRDPESIKKYLSTDEYKLYKMIYCRALASLMADSIYDQTTIDLENNGYLFRATGSVLKFPGYLEVYKDYEKNEDVVLPDISHYQSKVLISEEITKTQHFTKPKSRYTEASLIKEMESLGIGRPSTYAKTTEILRERDYVTVIDKKFHPTEIGIETTNKLQEFFSDLINVKYTAQMETELDEISENKINNIKVLTKFYNDFEPLVEKAFSNMEKKAPEETGEVCPNCGSPMVIRNGKYGKFEACSNYPTCKYIKKQPKEVKEIINCPKCDGKIIEKKTKRGKIFYGCSNYPKCDFASWDKPIEEKCPECGSILVEKKDKIKCSNCDYEK